MVPVKPEREVPLWYQYYFQLERGWAGLAANRREIAKILWRQGSPNWHFDDATFDRTALAFDNPDYVDIVIHSYRHRFGLADGDQQYADLQRRLAALPAIAVPTVTLDGDADGVVPATDGTASATKFTGRRTHQIIPRAGHNLPQEEPEAFADFEARIGTTGGDAISIAGSEAVSVASLKDGFESRFSAYMNG
jgi:pimeloyl-ACP methyl ester carboxylesterase